jgi:hypothetical protein
MQHTNCVACYGVKPHDGLSYLNMPHRCTAMCKMTTLGGQRMRTKPLSGLSSG